jgi:phosphatidylglycerophosphatase A
MNGEKENFFEKLIVFIATGFGLGLSPVASGTAGTLLGVVILFVMGSLSLGWQITVSVILAIIAMPICGIAEDFYGKKDDGRIVADEYLTFPICMLGLPWATHWWLLVIGFIVNRLLDIIKPPPAHQAQDLVGGIGIVMDDVISSLYALGVNHAIWYLISK